MTWSKTIFSYKKKQNSIAIHVKITIPKQSYNWQIKLNTLISTRVLISSVPEVKELSLHLATPAKNAIKIGNGRNMGRHIQYPGYFLIEMPYLSTIL